MQNSTNISTNPSSNRQTIDETVISPPESPPMLIPPLESRQFVFVTDDTPQNISRQNSINSDLFNAYVA